jgi:hypothetical protein
LQSAFYRFRRLRQSESVLIGGPIELRVFEYCHFKADIACGRLSRAGLPGVASRRDKRQDAALAELPFNLIGSAYLIFDRDGHIPGGIQDFIRLKFGGNGFAEFSLVAHGLLMFEC